LLLHSKLATNTITSSIFLALTRDFKFATGNSIRIKLLKTKVNLNYVQRFRSCHRLGLSYENKSVDTAWVNNGGFF
jgi:hypothetical protein